MPQPRARTVVSQPAAAASASPSWAEWPSRLQALQLQLARDMAGVFARYVGGLAAARDLQAVVEAQRTGVAEWMTWIEGAQRQWAELSRALPPEALVAAGWRLKPAARALTGDETGEGSRDLLEQSKLGFEMLLRPWMPAPDLEHTDEFVA